MKLSRFLSTILELYSEISLSRKPFGIGHMYIYNFWVRMTDTVTSQNIDPSSWDILYIVWCYELNPAASPVMSCPGADRLGNRRSVI
jgi:hypothetical protein